MVVRSTVSPTRSPSPPGAPHRGELHGETHEFRKPPTRSTRRAPAGCRRAASPYWPSRAWRWPAWASRPPPLPPRGPVPPAPTRPPRPRPGAGDEPRSRAHRVRGRDPARQRGSGGRHVPGAAHRTRRQFRRGPRQRPDGRAADGRDHGRGRAVAHHRGGRHRAGRHAGPSARSTGCRRPSTARRPAPRRRTSPRLVHRHRPQRCRRGGPQHLGGARAAEAGRCGPGRGDGAPHHRRAPPAGRLARRRRLLHEWQRPVLHRILRHPRRSGRIRDGGPLRYPGHLHLRVQPAAPGQLPGLDVPRPRLRLGRGELLPGRRARWSTATAAAM